MLTSIIYLHIGKKKKKVSYSKKNENHFTVSRSHDSYKKKYEVPWPPCAEHFPSHSAWSLWRGTPFPSFLHLKGLFKGPRAAIDFRTLISRLHYEEFCYLHLRPVFLPPSALGPPCGLWANPPSQRRSTITHTHAHALALPRERTTADKLTRQRPEQPAGNGDRWRSKCWAVGHKSSETKNRQDFKERRKKHSRETTSNLNMHVKMQWMFIFMRCGEFSTWLPFPVSLPGNSSRLRRRLTWILCGMLTHDKGVDW